MFGQGHLRSTMKNAFVLFWSPKVDIRRVQQNSSYEQSIAKLECEIALKKVCRKSFARPWHFFPAQTFPQVESRAN